MDIGTLVPQLFYDLIGRVIPGATLLASFFILYEGPQKAFRHLATWSSNPAEANIPVTIILLGDLLAAHILASLLGGLWFRVFRTDAAWESRWRPIGDQAQSDYASSPSSPPPPALPPAAADQAQSDSASPKSVEEGKPLWTRLTNWLNPGEPHFNERFNYFFSTSKLEPPDNVIIQMDMATDRIAYMYDYVLLQCPKAGARIAKLRAEQHMSGVLMLGFFLLAVYCFVSPYIPPAGWLAPYIARADWRAWLICEIILVAAVISAFSLAQHLEKRCNMALLNLWFVTASGKQEK